MNVVSAKRSKSDSTSVKKLKEIAGLATNEKSGTKMRLKKIAEMVMGARFDLVPALRA